MTHPLAACSEVCTTKQTQQLQRGSLVWLQVTGTWVADGKASLVSHQPCTRTWLASRAAQ